VKEAFYFPHDSNARFDPDIVMLRFRYQWHGYGIYWGLVEKLREQRTHRLKRNYEIIAYEFQTKPEDIKDIIENFGLFKKDRTYFWSESLNRRMEEIREKKIKGRLSAKARWGETEPGSRSKRLAAARKKGSHTAKEWKEMTEFFGACVKCGAKPGIENLQKNRITPISKGGSDSIRNIQPLCPECVQQESDGDTDYRETFLKETNACEMPAKWVRDGWKKGKERKGKEKKVKTVTWLTPYALIYEKKCNADMPFGEAAKYLKMVEERIGHDKAVGAFDRYCKATPVRFISISRFQKTLKEWEADDSEIDEQHTGGF
jgi:5-methylcytosine-specific restriction endonuclease McrA